MKTFRTLVPAFAALIILSGFCTSKPSESEQGKDNVAIKLPAGFTATVFADKIGPARHLAINENGNIYMALSTMKNGGGIAALKDSNGDGKADETKYFGKTATTGIEFKDGFLYYSNSVEVYRVPVAKDELVPSGEQQLIVTGFLKQNQHQDKAFALDNDGNIYVNVGAPSNACQVKDRTPGSPGQDPCPLLERHAGIWKFRADKPGQDQMKDGSRYATGIRNAIALAWNYSNNKLYLLQHGRDQLFQFYPDLYNEQQGAELPAEEFFQVNNGDNFGWPYCYYDQMQKQKVLAPEYGGDGKKKGRCTDAKDPILAFPGHLAPNDLLFYTGNMFPEKYREGAFIAFHGSWNRAPLEQKGYFVAFVPFRNGLPSGDWEIFADGFAGVSPIKNMNEIKYRPMGLVQGPDGSLFISDSEEGRIWKVTYTESK
jgi:glucose/arabinose dehydrogenase